MKRFYLLLVLLSAVNIALYSYNDFDTDFGDEWFWEEDEEEGAIAMASAPDCIAGGPGTIECTLSGGVGIAGGLHASCTIKCNPKTHYACCSYKCECVPTELQTMRPYAP